MKTAKKVILSKKYENPSYYEMIVSKTTINSNKHEVKLVLDLLKENLELSSGFIYEKEEEAIDFFNNIDEKKVLAFFKATLNARILV